jgi:hypothetical protein
MTNYKTLSVNELIIAAPILHRAIGELQYVPINKQETAIENDYSFTLSPYVAEELSKKGITQDKLIDAGLVYKSGDALGITPYECADRLLEMTISALTQKTKDIPKRAKGVTP